MSRVCPITGKGPLSGNKRSHSMRATKRSWGVNLQKVKVEINGQVRTIRVSARALKTLKKAQKSTQGMPKQSLMPSQCEVFSCQGP